ncbi:MAG: antibiotic biosynthesis monooxygenase [Flavobacteriales bacterium]|nr:antibiotic biosynthesis monooxygenase [Flavobacteriales bacterium]|tara:strand:- start:437 stop:757 length:321 start_codon:yes stop_codon:yes gene_type:complete
MFAKTPKPPYYAVIFTAVRTDIDDDYAATSKLMRELAAKVDGYLGIETAGDGEEITVSYWRDLEAIQEWRSNTDHKIAKEKGRKDWYKAYISRIALVEREYGFSSV